MYTLYKYPRFGFLWFAQLLVYIGEAIFNTALIWWFLNQKVSGTDIGLVLSIASLPAVLIGPFAGTFVDIINPKLAIILADIFRIVIIVYFSQISYYEEIKLRIIYFLIVLYSSFGVFHAPATLSVISKFVKKEDLSNATAIHSINRDVSKLLGPSICGIIIANLSISAAFKTFSFLLFIAIIIVLLIPFPEKKETNEHSNFYKELKEGFLYLKDQEITSKMLAMFSFVNFFVIPIIILIPFSVKNLFNKGSYELGLSESILALGSIFVGLIYDYLFSSFSSYKFIFYQIALSGFIYVILGLNNSFGIFLALLFILGMCFASVNISIIAHFQRTIKEEMKGRFFSFVEVISYVTFPLSLAFFGYVCDKISISYVYFLCGASIIMISFYFKKIIFLKITR